MEKDTELIDRRIHKRYAMQPSAFVSIRPGGTNLGQIMDLSIGGLAFRYMSKERPSGAFFQIDLFSAENGFYLEEVPFRTIWDVETDGQLPFSALSMRRRGGEFGELTDHQRTQLAYFMEHYSEAEA